MIFTLLVFVPNDLLGWEMRIVFIFQLNDLLDSFVFEFAFAVVESIIKADTR